MQKISRCLSGEREPLKRILEAIQDGVVLLDKSGGTVSLNRAMQDILGRVTNLPISSKCLCDQDGLVTTLGNVVENAVKFTRLGHHVPTWAREKEAG